MKSIYISGPYTMPDPEGVKQNMLRAAEVSAGYIRKGFAVFCPHTMTHEIDRIFNIDGDIVYDDWLTMDLYWLAKCDAIHMMPGWKNSKGASIEYLVAKALGLDVYGAAL